MSLPWYEKTDSSAPISQGDIIFSCPIVSWSDDEITPVKWDDNNREFESDLRKVLADVIVMTQACDLEHNKVKNVLLCPHYSLSSVKEQVLKSQVEKGQNLTEKAWRRYCEELKNGFNWNLSLLNPYKDSVPEMEHRVVDFHEVYTVPKRTLESFVNADKSTRIRLLPPYREHLSQAFARYFMRVGLPENITKAW